MADLVPAGGPASAFSGGGSVLTRLSAITQQPAVKKMLPVFIGLSAIGGAALTWSLMAPTPQRVLYAQLDDSERAGVAEALDGAQIAYRIDNQTGALTVSEADYYKARMLVAQDGALSTPESGDAVLDKLPMGASRTLEGQRLRSAREHDLQLTIGQIDGVEAVRVHLAEAERSVFVRDNVAPTASVMVRLRSGRNLSQSQVSAIVNLVAGSVPGLSADAVRVVDQHGQLLSEGSANGDNERLDMQARLESKLREQVSQLLTPMLGDGKFTTEAQVELNMDQVTAARESYDKDGVVRTEQQQQSSTAAPGQAGGIPGALSNTPPPATQAVPGPPQGTATPAPNAAAAPQNGESSSSRTYELGRQVSVSETGPGNIKRLTVAVAISADAMKGAKAQEIQDLQALVSAAVGADPQRGDTVKIVTRAFSPVAVEETPFYETDWFAMIVRNGAAVLAVLLVLLLGVRPMITAMRGGKPAKKGKKGDVQLDDSLPSTTAAITARPEIGDVAGVAVEISRAELLARQLEIAQRLVAEKPDSAVLVLRQMLSPPDDQKAA
ncbi:flagellar basal-body MS-ring/collar protein FliF [Novosphingobium guangzhouense]|uniref:Flagellar M-ring protein n=1 Tax=Novosphingobium guangzhouense TaxID=1850347 RepID=A0A2K2FZJ3_9SPHN|nr:flagellar basal-body MS-ring/collar protein FliF [Novosphingobium guangzhouense]PNU04182.1 flagellar M-ring protein FliF [Novosphingobium guangzhouense]